MPVYIVRTNQQLTYLIPRLTADYLDKKWIHVCKFHHHNCSENYQLWQNGQHPILSVVYIPAYLEQGIKIILNNLIDHFPNDEDDNDEDDDNNNVDVDNMMMCPGCGLPFSEQ